MHTLLSTSATENEQGDLVPLSARVIEWVYGNPEYLQSVFGSTSVNRSQLREYYQEAERTWTKVPFNDLYGMREQATSWLRSANIKGLDYFFPFGRKYIWFKSAEDAFAFRLKFGIIDKKSDT